MVVFMNEDFLYSSKVEHYEVEVFGSNPNKETNIWLCEADWMCYQASGETFESFLTK